MEGSFVGLQVADILTATVPLNILGGFFSLAGAWRVAEPILMKHELRNLESSHLFTSKHDEP